MLAHSTMAQPDSTWLHLTLPKSTQIYSKLQWLYLKLETGEALRMRLVRAEIPSELETPHQSTLPQKNGNAKTTKEASCMPWMPWYMTHIQQPYKAINKISENELIVKYC